MAINNKSKKHMSSASSSLTKFQSSFLFIVLFTGLAIILLFHTPSSPSPCSSTSSGTGDIGPWVGDLRVAQFAWNRLSLVDDSPPPAILKIAVFSRKWPTGSAPGGMERHALTLHTALARRGHKIHVFTSPPTTGSSGPDQNSNHSTHGAGPVYPQIHYHEGEPGRWRYDQAWDMFEAENQHEPFDAVHSESVALPHHRARRLSNLVVSWHGIALESLQSSIYQDLTRKADEPMSPAFSKGISEVVPKILSEIRFFQNYAHHVAISDSCGEMLRDVYQIPNKRVHVIINGVDEEDFVYNQNLGNDFRNKLKIPKNATLVLGVAGRLVKDKGHPLLHEAFSKLVQKHHGVYLIVAGSGPWENRYRELGPQVIVLGSMGPSELKGFYNSIDVFVNPTLRPQGLDLTLMEAMMSGKPVLASRFPSIKGTIVVDEEFGFMFSPNAESLLEALEAVVSEGAERLAGRGRACRKYASYMFTARKMALAYERLFLCIKNITFCDYPSSSD